MMATRGKKQQSGIVRCFEVSDPTLHQKGYTIYKVTQRIIKVDCPEEDIQEIIVWRRFNDFKKLYKAMVKLHEALHRNEEFPPFVEAKLFGRFGEEVIKRRMLVGQDLLNFIGQRHYLVASRAFQQFFQDGEIHKYEGVPPLIQTPTVKEHYEPCRNEKDDNTDTTCIDNKEPDHGDPSLVTDEESLRVPGYNELLGGVWRYRQIAEEISLGGDDDNDDEADFTDDSALSTPLPDSDMIFFDPLKSGEEDKSDTTVSNEWLLSQSEQSDLPTKSKTKGDDELKKLEKEFAACNTSTSPLIADIIQPQSSSSSPLSGSLDFFGENLDDFDDSQHSDDHNDDGSHYSESSTSQSESVIPNKVRSGVVVESGKGDLVMSPVHKDKSSTFHRPLHSLTSTPSSSPQHGTSVKSSPQHSPQRRGLVNIDVKDKADYIFLAANQISLAQQCEANSNYHMAFSYYKSAVGIMLTGVQRDDNQTRREVVRKKTAKYLLKAEKLYHMYLDSREDGIHDDRWDTGKPSPAKELDPNAAFLQGSLSEMKNFKVLGIIDKVLLIIDTVTDQTYVIKVLHKSCSGPLHHRSIVPVHLPYIVQLHKFYETDNAIYLLLQHATGGKLWSYISGYLQQQNNSETDLNNVLTDQNEAKPQAKSVTQNNDITVTGGDLNIKSPEQSDARKNCAQFNHDDNKPFIQQSSVLEGSGSILDSKPEIVHLNSVVHEKGGNNSLSLNAVQGPLPPSQLKYSYQHSLSQSISQESQSNDDLKDANLTDVMEQQEQFEELLKGTKCKPSLEQFSINSFDSDSGPGSRYESQTSDYIESIPELSEVTDVINTDESDVLCSWPADNMNTNTHHGKIIESAVHVIEEAAKELHSDILHENGVPPGHHDQVVRCTDPGPGDTSASTPDDEPSIYDKYKEQDSSDASSESDIMLQCHQQTNSDPKPVTVTSTATTSLPITTQSTHSSQVSQSRSASSSPQKSADLQPKQIFRVHSQDRSADGEVKPRKRQVSSLFDSFNLDSDKLATVRLPEECVRQWAAEIVLALANLHSMGLICRDLKPANLLLGDQGHILLTYFSQWNSVDQVVDNSARDQLYAAPEVGSIKRQLPSCDWWSLGAILYELLTGRSLSSCLPCGVSTHTQISVPDYLSDEAQDLLKQLLKYNPEERLGAGTAGVEEIKMHPFFIGLDWTSLQG